MRQAYRLVVCLFALCFVWILTWQSTQAQEKFRSLPPVVQRPVQANNLSAVSSSRPASRRRTSRRWEIEATLYEVILSRLGTPYRANGTDERGYDCSGFVWRTFQDAGIYFPRSTARTLWETLPEATPEEAQQFGTLVFFRGSGHVGIVRDAQSFYHASTSQGVIRSFYSSYWGTQVIGFRRIPLPDEWELSRR